ncbi:hematopoietic death receptor isoform X2 [Cheilinus undulatus]|uniref:hematopoietic death receptor isoform X2 n=1 Tax=Cheilinus undulatus TaxID=241271 RepID=UPI001BD30A44|nr:hematopoietic death receptor isoform X2 [Cheilinus undulatus]
MTKFLKYAVLMVLIWPITLLGDVQTSDFDLSIRRTRRDLHCKIYEEYLHGSICCLNCPAGTRMMSPCTVEGRRGGCEECDEGTYTEHSNALRRCFRCTECRSDEEIVKPCTRTQNTECQCKSGGFCPPDQACETCKKCSRCQKDEEIVRNCTSTSNTVCKKTRPSPESTSGKEAIIISLSLLAAGVLSLVVALFLRRRCKATESLRSQHVGLKAVQQYSDNCQTDERRNGATKRLSCSSLGLPGHLVRIKGSAMDEHETLCESLSSSASNSQHSLTGLPSSTCSTSPPPAGFMIPQSHQRDDEEFLKLVPVNGEESLRKCFEYFEEIDVDYHKRFFRQLGISDNVVKSKEHLHYEDKIHELLNIWVEKEGKEGSLNHLLKALLDLNQRRTAETIKDNAIANGHYCLSED